jgi:predicted aconitase with swiveling domain
MERVLTGRPVVAGRAKGTALVSKEPLSFWGGFSASTGEIIDRRHRRSGAIVTGRIFVFPKGKGSSTASAILLDSIRAGTAPAAIINLKTDPILALGAIVAEEMYGRSLPIVVLEEDAFHSIREGDALVVEPDGTVKVSTAEGGED